MSNPMPEDPHILASNILAPFPKPRERQENDWQENCCSQSSCPFFAAKSHLAFRLNRNIPLGVASGRVVLKRASQPARQRQNGPFVAFA
jgi:hypothetical protein